MCSLGITVLRFFLLALCMLASCASVSQEMTQREQEAALKSAYLVNFARFVRWRNDDKKVRFCLSSESAVYPYISRVDMLDVGSNRELVLVLDPVSLERCHLYFVDAKSISSMPDLQENAHPDLLAITDIPGSQGKGYTVQFFLRDLKLRFVVDEKLIDASSYQVSSKILRMSRRLD